jgi:3',5'-cyclic AMP phosphodiesterase CpdA
MKNFFSKLFLAAFILSFLTAAEASALQNGDKKDSKLPNVRFDDKNVVLRFAAISDIHIMGKDQKPSQRLYAALEQLNARAGGKLDVVFITGDLTEMGYPAQAAELKRVFDSSSVDLNKTRLVFAIGNHEYFGYKPEQGPWRGGFTFKDAFGDQAYIGATDEEIQAANYHAVVGGYDFIAVNCSKYGKGVTWAESDIAWLKEQLAKAAKERPGKPIFVGSHPNITGTNQGSNEGTYWNGRGLYDVLKDYPQAIYFCGHLHFSEANERNIWQGDFTTIGLASLFYLSNHIKDDDNGNTFIDVMEGFRTFDADSTPSQGVYGEIDKSGNVRLTKLDFTHKEEIKSPWLVPAPKEDKSHLLYYTPEQLKLTFGGEAPYFEEGSYVQEVSKDNGDYYFKFSQAKDNDLVLSYQISFIDNVTGKEIKNISALSDFYMHANPRDMAPVLTKFVLKADSVLAPFNTHYENDYYIQVIALDCYGQKSAPVKSSVIKGSGKKTSMGNGQGLLMDKNLYRPSVPAEKIIGKPSKHLNGIA